MQGLDYPISALVTLRTLCQEAGGYQVPFFVVLERDGGFMPPGGSAPQANSRQCLCRWVGTGMRSTATAPCS